MFLFKAFDRLKFPAELLSLVMTHRRMRWEGTEGTPLSAFDSLTGSQATASLTANDRTTYLRDCATSRCKY